MWSDGLALPAMLRIFLLLSLFYRFAGAWEEVTAYLDEYGRLHFNGEVYDEVLPEAKLSCPGGACQLSGIEPPSSVDVPKTGPCSGDAHVAVSYGGQNAWALPPLDGLRDGGKVVLPCSQVFGHDAFGGPIVLNCANGSLTSEVHCGCARKGMPPPVPPDDCANGIRSRNPLRTMGYWQDGVIFLKSLFLAEGEQELHSCSELGLVQNPDADWSFKCTAGELAVVARDCYCAPNKSRRLSNARIPACEQFPEDDFWWPTFCASVRSITQATFAGAMGSGTAMEQLNEPRGISIDTLGTVYIADQPNMRVQQWTDQAWLLNAGGEVVAGVTGSAGDFANVRKLNKPADVVIGTCRDVYICDTYNNRIMLFRAGFEDGIVAAGGGIENDGTPGSDKGQLHHPEGLYVDRVLDLYIADTQNHRVVRWSQTPPYGLWTYATTIAGTNTIPGDSLTPRYDNLRFPKDVFVTKDRRIIYIADTGNDRIVKVVRPCESCLDAFDRNLFTLSEVGDRGDCPGPLSVHADSMGNVFASCPSLHCIRRWDWDQNRLVYKPVQDAAGKCGTEGLSPLKTDTVAYDASMALLSTPKGVFVDEFGSIYVSDTGNARVIRSGRTGLSQWILSNAIDISQSFWFDLLEFHSDRDCTKGPTELTFLSYNGYSWGVVKTPAGKDGWKAECISGGCLQDTVWLGRAFMTASTVQCIRVRVLHNRTEPMAFSVKYWTGLTFEVYYTFGGIAGGVETKLKLPRFVPYTGYCIKGRASCTMANISGDWHANGDKIMIKDFDCVRGVQLPGFPGGSISQGATELGSSFTIGNERAESDNSWIGVDANNTGAYQVCWCDMQVPGSSCRLAADFLVTVGYVIVEGPFEQQVKDCWRGQRLVVTNIQGVNLRPNDSLAVVAGQCGPSSSAVADFPSSGTSQPSKDGTTFYWIDGYVLATPGWYQMCWCRPFPKEPCKEAREFRGNSGQIKVNGPRVGQNFNCIRGYPCNIRVEYGNSADYRPGDTVMPSKTSCGEDSAVEGFPNRKVGENSAENLQVFSWGARPVISAVGLYYICWCTILTNCKNITDYRAEVGIVTIYGPEPLNVTCTLGRICGVDPVAGVGTANGDHLIVLKNDEENQPGRCGHQNATNLPGFPGDDRFGEAISKGSTDNGRAYVWGKTEWNKTTHGKYKICWCSGPQNCTHVGKFRSPMGLMTVRGPALRTSEQGAFICGAGRQCTIDLDGTGLSSDTDRIIAKTCIGQDINEKGRHCCREGSQIAQKKKDPNPLQLRLSVMEAMSEAKVQGRVHEWTADQIPYGGQASVCWCGSQCFDYNDYKAVEESYNVRVGALSITAPAAGVNATCMSGGPCTIELTGVGLQSTNRLALLQDQCGGDGQWAKNFPSTQSSSKAAQLVGSFKNVSRFTYGSWESGEFIRSTATILKACWCSESCSLKGTFVIDVGIVTILAPYYYVNTKRFQCWTGQTCKVQGVDGYGLGNGDKLRIAAYCAQPLQSSTLPNSGISNFTNNSGSYYDWGERAITSPPQQFELCWCSGIRVEWEESGPKEVDNPCSSSNSFVTHIGYLRLGGPYGGEKKDCDKGQKCVVTDIQGMDFRMYDSMLLLLTCGAGDFVPGLPYSGAVDRATCEVSPCRGWKVGWWALPSGQEVTSFKYLRLGGNDTEAAERPPNPYQDESRVTFMVPDPDYMLQAAPQMYRMCWCPESSPTCTRSSDFNVDMGLLTVSGPRSDQGWDCVPGFICELTEIIGVQLDKDERWAVMDDPVCSQAKPVRGFPDGGMSMNSVNDGKTVKWSSKLLRDTDPKTYNLCWCPGSGNENRRNRGLLSFNKEITCNNIEEYNSFAGTLTVVGPIFDNSEFDCGVGAICRINGISGVGLRDNDLMIIVDGDCGPDSKIIPNFARGGMSYSGTFSGSEYTFPELNRSIAGKTYSMCWCPRSRQEQCDDKRNGTTAKYCCIPEGCTDLNVKEGGSNSETCMINEPGWTPIKEQFSVKIGNLVIPGTPQATEEECVSGRVCQVVGVTGIGGAPLVDGAQIRVVEHDDGDISRTCDKKPLTGVKGFPNDGESEKAEDRGANYYWREQKDQPYKILAAGGIYAMCWRRSNQEKDFDFYAGKMTVYGPQGDQLFTCTRKALCELKDLRGHKLRGGDFVMILGLGCQTRQKVSDKTEMITSRYVKWEARDFEGAVGKYELCWCREECDDIEEDFKMPIGILTIRGPLPGQNQECNRGLPCTVERIAGFSLEEGDKAEIQVECGTGPVVAGFENQTAIAKKKQIGDEISFDFLWPVLRAKPGIYRICWCAKALCPDDTVAYETRMFNIEVGIIRVQGPSDLSEATVTPFLPMWGLGWTILLKGVRLQMSKKARLRMLTQCGRCNTSDFNTGQNLSVVNRQTLEYTPVAQALRNVDPEGYVFKFDEENMRKLWPVAEYCFCWCMGDIMGDEKVEGAPTCESLDDFTLDLGRISVVCRPGQENRTAQGCFDCPRGKWKTTAKNELCYHCDDITHHTTFAIGATSSKQCYCKPGYRTGRKGGTCDSCDENKFCEGGFMDKNCSMKHFCIASSGDNPGYAPTGCLEDFESRCIHTQPVQCPNGSGAWEFCQKYDEDLQRYVPKKCDGSFPAPNVSQCSCKMGFQPNSTGNRCDRCPNGFIKKEHGNGSCTNCNEILDGSTTKNNIVNECECGPTTTTSLDGTQCDKCPVGFYCPGFQDRVGCPENTTTDSPGKQNESDCQCAPGYFRQLGECVPCRTNDYFYKEDVGDKKCDKKCPENSIIPANYVGGARGPESCLCSENFTLEVNLSSETTAFQCERKDPSEEKYKNYTNVPEVTTYMVIAKAYPSDVFEKRDKLREALAGQLGFAVTDRISVEIVKPYPLHMVTTTTTTTEEPARRLFMGEDVDIPEAVPRKMSGAGAPSGFPDYGDEEDYIKWLASYGPPEPPIEVTVKFRVWQSTLREAANIKQVQLNHARSESQVLLDGMTASLRKPIPTVDDVYFSTDAWSTPTHMQYTRIDCLPFTALHPGVIFEAENVSCECIQGYYPWELAMEDGESNDHEAWRIENPRSTKCVPCRSVGIQGKYKETLSDTRCEKCDKLKYTSTKPKMAAISQENCTCPAGQYRQGDECEDCPPDTYCEGDNIKRNCPKHTNTLPEMTEPATVMKQCECSRGFFRAGDTNLCAMCDEGYYKSKIEDGPGRCTDRCSALYGFRSTSPKGASSSDECFCASESFLKNVSGLSSTCSMCPSKGVVCKGGFEYENITGTNETRKVHRKPVAQPGFFMIDPNSATVAECRADGGNVCLENNVCVPGHADFICGTCDVLWTRDQFQKSCRHCDELYPTPALFFMMLLDLTFQTFWNGLLTASAIGKTEAQKNILPVLLRMYTHWSSQVVVLANFDLASLQSIYGETPGFPDTAPPEKEDGDNATNATDGDEDEAPAPTPAPEEGDGSLNWPDWQQEAMKYLVALQGAMPSIGSTQEMLECIVDRHSVIEDPLEQRYWKLLVPAVYWFMYPIIMFSWVIMWSWFFSRIVVRIILWATGEVAHRKKNSKKKTGNARKMPRLRGTPLRTDIATQQLKNEMSDSSSDSESIFSSEDPGKVQDDVRKALDNLDMDERERQLMEQQIGSPTKRDWTLFAGVMNKLTILPMRFNRRKSQRELDNERVKQGHHASNEEDDEEKVHRVLTFFTPGASFPELVNDISPWLVVTLNNIWMVTTSRLLQLLYCETFPLGEVRLMMSTHIKCWSDPEHKVLAGIGVVGLLCWSVGSVACLNYIISQAVLNGELQSTYIQRTYGYLLEGYEPRACFWELRVKKLDLLATALITYTSFASQVTVKIMLYAVLAHMMITVQISFSPYDNRQIDLLDRVENFGLMVRFCLFWGIALCLLFGFNPGETMMVAGVIVSVVGIYMLKLLIFAADDLVTSQYLRTNGSIVMRKKEADMMHKKGMKRAAKEAVMAKALKAKEAAKEDGQVNEDQYMRPRDKYAEMLRFYRGILMKFRRFFQVDFRQKQLLRFNWSGPTSDAILYTPEKMEGMNPAEVAMADKKGAEANMKYSNWSGFKAYFNRWLWNLDSDAQIDFAVTNIESFIYMLIVSAKFGQLPARLTDIMMLLAGSITRLRNEQLYNPEPRKKKKKPKQLSSHLSKRQEKKAKAKAKAAVEPTKKERLPPEHEHDDSSEEDIDTGAMQLLKAVLLEDIFTRLSQESEERHKLMDAIKPSLRHQLKERLVPEELAWELLGMMTTMQLKAVLINPNQILLRIRFYILLLQCEVDREGTLKRITEQRKVENKEREEVMTFMEFILRSPLENSFSMHWDEVRLILNKLPVEDLRVLANDRDGCLTMLHDMHQQSLALHEKHMDFDAVTVEDLNNMVMFLQKLTYEELHEILEYTQLLLDFLQLPYSEAWTGHQLRKENLAEAEEDLQDAEDAVDAKRKLLEQLKQAVEEATMQQAAEKLAQQQKMQASKDDSTDSRNASKESTPPHGTIHGQVPTDLPGDGSFVFTGRVVKEGSSSSASQDEHDHSYKGERRDGNGSTGKEDPNRRRGMNGYANGHARSRLTTLDEERSHRWDGQSSRPAVGKMPPTRVSGGVGLLNQKDTSPSVSGMGSTESNMDDDTWSDFDDDDPAVTLDWGIDEDQMSIDDPRMAEMADDNRSVGGRSHGGRSSLSAFSGVSGVSGLSSFSDMGPSDGNGDGQLTPRGDGNNTDSNSPNPDGSGDGNGYSNGHGSKKGNGRSNGNGYKHGGNGTAPRNAAGPSHAARESVQPGSAAGSLQGDAAPADTPSGASSGESRRAKLAALRKRLD